MISWHKMGGREKERKREREKEREGVQQKGEAQRETYDMHIARVAFLFCTHLNTSAQKHSYY